MIYALLNLQCQNKNNFNSFLLRLGNNLLNISLFLLLFYGYFQNEKHIEAYQKEHIYLAQNASQQRASWQASDKPELISSDLQYLISYDLLKTNEALNKQSIHNEFAYKKWALDINTIQQDLYQSAVYEQILQKTKSGNLQAKLLAYIDQQKTTILHRIQDGIAKLFGHNNIT